MKKVLCVYLVFTLKLLIAFWLFSFCRILFYLFNASFFPQVEFINFLGGIRFDWMTITILFLPFLVGTILFPSAKSKILRFLFLLSAALGLIFNFLDLEYFKFTSKRTTFDIFKTSGLENDILQLLPVFFKDYWYVFLLFIITLACTSWLYGKADNISRSRLNLKQHFAFILPLAVFLFLGFRGGYQYRPLNVINAAQYATAKNIPLVLNTPFTMMKSSYKSSLTVNHYFPDNELISIYNPLKEIKGDSSKRTNVLLLIMESFSKEYMGKQPDGYTFTPFLDSLLGESLYFENTFANGKKSIEALPAILSGIPTLMNTAYISSKYGTNKIESIASVLNDEGYSSSFYHGGENGTMGFKAFTQVAGIDRYIGRDEYPYKGDYDGNWGIFDEPFLQFVAEDLSKNQKPFFAGVFTLSSHHPYTIPEKHKGKFKEGKLPILQSISYADYSLKQFFKKAKTTEWYQNTLFIITADHTQHNLHHENNNAVGNYRVPLAFFSPTLNNKRTSKAVAQQNDIFPTTLALLGINKPILNFGNNLINSSSFSVNYLNGIYQLIEGDYCLQFDGEQSIAFYNYITDPLLQQNLVNSETKTLLPVEEKLKSIIQQYQERLINNNLTTKE